MPGREQAEQVQTSRRRELGETLRAGSGREFALPEDETVEYSVAEQAAKEVDSERRELSGIAERMRARQNYFYEKAQMHREAADHYTRMSEDIAEMLNNDYLNKNSRS